MDKKEAEEARSAVLRAKAAHEEAEAAKLRLEAAVIEITLAKARRAEEAELATNKFYHTYVFDSVVSDQSVEKCIDQLTQWMRRDSGCDIEIIFFSPGGGIVPGMALFDFIQRVRKAGHRVTTMALGMAASMAGILLQAGDERVMGKEAWVLIHEASFGAQGKIGDVEDTVEWVKKVQKRILKIFASRCKLTETQIARRWKRKDWWISSDDCLKLGLVDRVE